MLGEALWQPKVLSNKGTDGSWAMETQQQYGKINGYITSTITPLHRWYYLQINASVSLFIGSHIGDR